MKIKKYTNGAWTDLDKPVKKFGAYTDTATTLPLTIEASATDAIENYQVYGTSEGAGVETESGEPAGFKIPILNTSGVTENLVEWIIEEANIGDTGVIINNTSFNMYIAKIAEGQEYTITTSPRSGYIYGLFRTFPDIYSQSYDNSRVTGQSTFTAPIDGYIAFRAVLSDTLVMLTKGSTPPDHYIPHRYESNYDLFLGDSKLYEDEYLDFVEQKMYKNVSGVLTPTDPPAPFPALSTYIGENNLSVDTTIQPEKVAVEYEGWKGVGDVEKYQNGEWSDNNGT